MLFNYGNEMEATSNTRLKLLRNIGLFEENILTCEMWIIAERNCIIYDLHLIFLMWLRCAGPAVHSGEQEGHTKFYLENFKHRNHIKKPKCMLCTCLPARTYVYEGIMSNCTLKKSVVKMGSVPWICLIEIHSAGNINVRIHTLEPEN
jgi:hypothetical protein